MEFDVGWFLWADKDMSGIEEMRFSIFGRRNVI